MAAPVRDPEAVTAASVVRRSGTAGTVLVDGQAVLVDEREGRAHALNPTGTVVWACLDGAGDLDALIDDLAAEFTAPRAVIAADVVELARQLARLGLLDGFGAAPDAWPEVFAPPTDDECAPDDPATAPPELDDRYLASPPNG